MIRLTRLLGCSATAVAVLDFFGEEIAEQFMCILPVVAVDAISHLWSFNGALYESGIFELLQMLAHGCLGDGQLIVNITEIALLPAGEEGEDLNPGGMSQSFGEAGYLLSLEAIVFLGIHGRLNKYDGNC